MKKSWLAFVLVIIGSARAADYYVSPSGDDSQDGTASRPWRTIQHAADTARAGDTVTISAGTYEESVVFHVSGSEGAPVRFAAAHGEEARLRGAAEFAKDVSHIALYGLTIQGFDVWGVFLRGGNSNIALSGLRVSGGDSGIRLTYGYSGDDPLEGPVSDILISDCLVEGALYSGIDCTPGPARGLRILGTTVRECGLQQGSSYGADGIAVEKGEDILVEGCRVHDNAGDGIDLNSRDRNGHVRGVVVGRNRVYRNRLNGIKVWSGGVIENNLVWGQGNTAVDIGAHPGTYRLANNTVAYNMWDPDWSVRSYALSAAYPDGETGQSAAVSLVLVNNIFAFNTGPEVGSPTGIYLGSGVSLTREGWNVFWSREDGEIQAEGYGGDSWFSRERIASGEWGRLSGQGQGDLCRDPLFVSGWPDVDLHLGTSSPALDAGTAQGAPEVDIDCGARPAGEGVDIGAFEMNATADPECAPGAASDGTKRAKRRR